MRKKKSFRDVLFLCVLFILKSYQIKRHLYLYTKLNIYLYTKLNNLKKIR